ncbi:MAG: methylenetetrahydrofolate--tRNA-(uracil(54)-C(5))-methyltransferase (FADH(2)-oxidizing) TrmFO [Clostridia bacterium]|nr:methylenetetrahydrofolate--tRNA-(uracil(54)-C(5))-methyltransferase (FADH(2)-oxidizing) TrmFO [Clostridia bacterium]
MRVAVIGAGLAGSEAAVILADAGIQVDLFECKPLHKSPAHKMDSFAELVCSNSLKAERIESAAGLLKWEMEQLGSVTVDAAKQCKVAAGGALAVDRYRFSEIITARIKENKNITIIPRLISEIPQGYDKVIIASGPLTCGDLPDAIKDLCGNEYLSFFDAAAPIVTAESVDMTKAFAASRYGKGDDDYINCPFNKAEYEAFHEALVSAERAEVHGVDKEIKVYEGCMPIEILASRGLDAARFGPMKPVGLVNPNTGHRPWAAVQLRKENEQGSMYNLVGFQTNLKFGEQQRVFSMIPGLENAEFVRYGVMHRNTFINSPLLLNADFSMRKNPDIYFAGQISGVEGYMESAASGIIAARSIISKSKGQTPIDFPDFTMLGALSGFISDETVKNFQPMGANFGILPPLDEKIRDKKQRYLCLANRSVEWFQKNVKR